MRIDTRDAGSVRVISCHGQMTLDAGADAMMRACDVALDDGARSLVVDLTTLSFLDSAGVGALVASAKHAGDRGAVMRIALPASGVVPRIFEITQLDRAFEVFTGVDEAVRSFRT